MRYFSIISRSLITKAQTGEVSLRSLSTFLALNIKNSEGGAIKGNLTMGNIEPDFI